MPAKQRKQSEKIESLHEYLARQLRETEAAVNEAQQDGSWQAAITGRRICVGIRREIDDLDREAAKTTAADQLPEDELIVRLEQMAARMPVQHLVLFVRAWCAASGVPVPEGA